jgi:hypothetical protein
MPSKAHPARLLEDRSAVLGGVIVEDDTAAVAGLEFCQPWPFDPSKEVIASPKASGEPRGC